MVAHLAYIQLVQSSSLWSQTNLLSHSFTSYWCWWYDQYKNSPLIFSRCLLLTAGNRPLKAGIRGASPVGITTIFCFFSFLISVAQYG